MDAAAFRRDHAHGRHRNMRRHGRGWHSDERKSRASAYFQNLFVWSRCGPPERQSSPSAGEARRRKSRPPSSDRRRTHALLDPIESAASSWSPSPHDLRRTVATRLASLGVPSEDVAACLNHVRREVTGRHYDVYARLIEKRRALDLWAQAIERIISGNSHHENVLPTLRKQRT
jgi:Phage integrase family